MASNHRNDVIKLLKSKLDGSALETMLRVTATCYGHEVVNELSELFESKDAQTRYLAVIHLGNFVTGNCKNSYPKIYRRKICHKKGCHGKVKSVGDLCNQPFIGNLKSPEKDLVYWALNSLGAIAEPTTTLGGISALLHSRIKSCACCFGNNISNRF